MQFQTNENKKPFEKKVFDKNTIESNIIETRKLSKEQIVSLQILQQSIINNSTRVMEKYMEKLIITTISCWKITDQLFGFVFFTKEDDKLLGVVKLKINKNKITLTVNKVSILFDNDEFQYEYIEFCNEIIALKNTKKESQCSPSFQQNSEIVQEQSAEEINQYMLSQQ